MGVTKGKITVKEIGSESRIRQSTKSCLSGRGVGLRSAADGDAGSSWCCVEVELYEVGEEVVDRSGLASSCIRDDDMVSTLLLAVRFSVEIL